MRRAKVSNCTMQGRFYPIGAVNGCSLSGEEITEVLNKGIAPYDTFSSGNCIPQNYIKGVDGSAYVLSSFDFAFLSA